MTDVLNRVLPILILLAIGYGIRRYRVLSAGSVEDLRKIVVNLALPAVLFTAFLNVELRSEDLVIVVTVFVVCVALYVAGRLLQSRLGAGHEYFPFLMTGFEAGMLGISLYGTVYGIDQVGHFAIVDLGHEVFIWFVYLAVLLARRDGINRPSQLVRAFFKAPVIIAILAGIAGNIAGIGESLYEWPATGGVMSTLDFLAGLTVPLILLIVGYGVQFDRDGIREAIVPVAVRLAMVLPLALVVPPLLVGSILDGSEYLQAALFTLLILPPPFIIPLYMRPGIQDERRYVNNVLSLYSLVSVAIFIVYQGVNPL